MMIVGSKFCLFFFFINHALSQSTLVTTQAQVGDLLPVQDDGYLRELC